MSEEDIKDALKIIKQPIIVNCKDYKYFDQENYDNLIRVYDNCLWYVNTFQPLLEQLQQENKELKERIEALKELDLYTCEADYDYEENLELNYVAFSIEEFLEGDK